MPFDPAKPAANAPNSSAEMRAQLTGLHALIPSSVIVDGVTTLAPGSSATATATLTGGVLHFTFALPAGTEGATGPPGEVSFAQLDSALAALAQSVQAVEAGSSANTNAVADLSIVSGDAVLQVLIAKVNELIIALRR